MKHWQTYIRSSYELVVEAEGKTAIYLTDDVENYLVRLVAKWFDKQDIPPDTPVAILMMTAMQVGTSKNIRYTQLKDVGDICLFYDSFKIKQRRWPTINYYKDMGTTAYGMAHVYSNDNLYEQLEGNFTLCSKILSNISNH